MSDITFEQLSVRYGEAAALAYLVEIEKAAQIAPRHDADPETRLTRACRQQDRLASLAA